ncbi:MBL fold metallo-hydrolase [Fretibacterium fastidiosum]|uniref:Zn-dependent hydrolases, including glyoxylases n=1 Tax=Fretibacterium fastidiosum TaxID=651822 RepID=A0AB94IWA5_9BACT|nr:MBL fold metallo-hydrolase [Fretibacterium fastidiosum]CBL28022.1 Zn-dependent hydrolases, including glyoxylases [Fretibacterium fastidiosum]
MTAAAGSPHDFGEGLFLIDLPQRMPGFRRFIASWFFVDALGRRVVVDPGPANTIPLLNGALERLTEDVDLVLLTHIHLDHAGGVGAFCRRWPRAAVLAHPRAFSHLRRPERLWSASVRTLGNVALAYGEPEPLTAPLLSEDPDGLIEVFPTPGHAPHHVALRTRPREGGPLLFIGEAAGLTLPSLDGALWLRPTTPPRFDAAAALSSLDHAAVALRGDERLCYAHWGLSEDPAGRLSLAREQTERWLELIGTMLDRRPEEVVECLLRRDPLLQARLDEDLMVRERHFMANSVQGFMGFLNEAGRGPAPRP